MEELRSGSVFRFMKKRILRLLLALNALSFFASLDAFSQPALPSFLRTPQLGKPLYFKGPPDTSKVFKVNPLWKASNSEDAVSPFLQSVESLDKSGSFARSFSAGTNQSAVLQSNFNLQVSGQLTPKVRLMANLTDNVQPTPTNGITQSLQDFDRIYVALQSDRFELGLGDLDVKNYSGNFLAYNRNVRGARLAFKQENGKRKNKQEFSFSSARGRFARQLVSVKEGNQGPYRLNGAQGETFIVILANSERVFLDGQLLKRGELYDYLIDYNTSVITFTPNRIITAQSRVIVEFEYANQAYVRSLTTAQFSEEQHNWLVSGRFFLERDLPNQPLQLNLDSNKRALLSRQYSGFGQGLVDGATPATFNTTNLFYKKTDSLGFSPVWVHSPVEQSGLFQVQFSFVGQGRGDYVPGPSLTNGRIYEWVAPEIRGNDTIRKGSYSPLVQLVAPVSQLGMSLIAGKKWANQSLIKVELLSSKIDSNVLAEPGIGRWGSGVIVEGSWINPFRLKAISANTRIERLSQDALITQPYRNQEFAREWLLPRLFTGSNEWLTDWNVNFSPDSTQSWKIGLKTLNAADYLGVKPYAVLSFRYKRLNANATLEGLQVKSDTTQGNYWRILSNVAYRLYSSSWFLKVQHESNLSKTSVFSPGAFRFTEIESGIRSLDSSSGTKQWEFAYNYRNDEQTRSGVLLPFQEGHTVKTSQSWSLGPTSIFKITASLRRSKFYLPDTAFGVSGNNFLLQSDFNYRSKDGVWQVSTFYNTGGGQEIRRDFVFLEVPKGQGTHIWVDYNQNGVKELNEFESSFFADQANFVRVLMPTTGFIPSLKSRVNYSIGIYPDRIRSSSGLMRLLKPFALLHSINLEQNLSASAGQWWEAPLLNQVSDRLISGLFNSRTTLFLFRTKRTFSLDLSWFQQQQQILGTNGLERNLNDEIVLKSRLSFLSAWLFETSLSAKNRKRSAEWAANRNYFFQTFDFEPQLSWLSESGWQVQGNMGWRTSKPIPADEVPGLEQWKTSAAVQFNSLKKGIFKLTFSRIVINFSGNTATALAFEMLQGLLPGNNLLWNMNWTRELGEGIQLAIQYEGRSSDQNAAIHTGRVQIRLLL